MTNAEYWKQRFTQLEAAQNRKGATAYLEMEKQYKAAQNELEAQIARWYQRFTDSNGISLAQAKQWLKGQDLAEFKWDLLSFTFPALKPCKSRHRTALKPCLHSRWER